MLIILQIQNPALRPGTGSFTSHSFEIILICLVMFLLGWFLHHLIYCSRHKARIAELESSLNGAQTRIRDLEGDLESCNAAVINVKGENASLSAKLSKLEKEGLRLESEGSTDLAELEKAAQAEAETGGESDELMIAGLAADIAGTGISGYNAEAAKAIFGRIIKEDDLKIVEGIGPKTESLLNGSSIHTWRQLGSTSVPQIQNILDKAGDRFRLLNPSTWPKQARMAANGEWSKLKDYQEYLVGGVEPMAGKVDSLEPILFLGKKFSKDDLTIVEGIGPKIQALLRENDIKSWNALAQSTVDQLKEILLNAGERYRIHNPATWPQQARLADEGKWDELEALQEYLDGGKAPE